MTNGLTNWMSRIEDHKSVGDIGIPGTHDSATSILWAANAIPIVNTINAFVQTQILSITNQLKSGVRFLDLRIRPGSDFPMYHGVVPLGIGLGGVLDDIDTFLSDNGTETVIVSIKSELDKDRHLIAADLKTFLDKRSRKMFMENRVPPLQEVRSRAVLFNRVHEKSAGIGCFINDKMSGSVEWEQANGKKLKFFIQDNYDPAVGWFESPVTRKIEIVADAYRQGATGTYDMRLNFLTASSAPNASPGRYAAALNPIAGKLLRENAQYRPWITILDDVGAASPDDDPIPAIISTNYLTRGRPAKEESELAWMAELKSGQKLVSPRRTYEARFQSDGDFAVVRTVDDHVMWSANTGGRSADVVTVQDDGNVVVKAGSKPVGASMTNGTGSARLVMQDDGNLVLYRGSGMDAAWASQTSRFHN